MSLYAIANSMCHFPKQQVIIDHINNHFLKTIGVLDLPIFGSNSSETIKKISELFADQILSSNSIQPLIETIVLTKNHPIIELGRQSKHMDLFPEKKQQELDELANETMQSTNTTIASIYTCIMIELIEKIASTASSFQDEKLKETKQVTVLKDHSLSSHPL